LETILKRARIFGIDAKVHIRGVPEEIPKGERKKTAQQWEKVYVCK